MWTCQKNYLPLITGWALLSESISNIFQSLHCYNYKQYIYRTEGNFGRGKIWKNIGVVEIKFAESYHDCVCHV